MADIRILGGIDDDCRICRDDNLERTISEVHGTNSPRFPALCTQIKSLLNSELSEWKNLEASLYVLCRGEGTSRASELPSGVGVAGRSAWMLRSIPWVNSPPEDPDDELADYYFRGDSSDIHSSVLAYPVSIEANEAPIAVISFATREHDGFYDLVRTQLPNSSPQERHRGRGMLKDAFVKARTSIRNMLANS